MFAISVALGMRAAPVVSDEMLKRLEEMLRPFASLGPLELFVPIFVNNAAKALGAILLGVLLGLPPLLFIIFNGFTIGAVISVLKASLGYGTIIASLAPHGVIEIPMLLLATALGLSVGKESLNRLAGRKSQVKSRLLSGLRVYIKWVLPGLLVAAAIEVFITPAIASFFTTP
ncbi:MAG: stage II sporulation protein M [Dehalococcoidia bacterium]|nr:stage II sporulation protein M [Dehalococcoidia bacterium]